MSIKKFIRRIISSGKANSNSWRMDQSVFQEMSQRIQELEQQNQALSDKNQALHILLDNTSRKLSSRNISPAPQTNK